MYSQAEAEEEAEPRLARVDGGRRKGRRARLAHRGLREGVVFVVVVVVAAVVVAAAAAAAAAAIVVVVTPSTWQVPSEGKKASLFDLLLLLYCCCDAVHVAGAARRGDVRPILRRRLVHRQVHVPAEQEGVLHHLLLAGVHAT